MSVWQRSAFAALAAIGVVAGVMAAWGGPAGTTGQAQPLAAASPSVPVDSDPTIVRDPEVARLKPGLPLVPTTIGTKFQVKVSVPRGWVRRQSNYNEYTWEPPAQPKFAYQLRVEQVSAENRTMDDIVGSRLADIDAATQDFKLVMKSPDTLEFTYVDSKHARVGLRRWVPVPGRVTAGVEISVDGRVPDRTGLADLMERVAATVVQPKPEATAN